MSRALPLLTILAVIAVATSQAVASGAGAPASIDPEAASMLLASLGALGLASIGRPPGQSQTPDQTARR